MKKVKIPLFLQKMGEIFKENGFESYLVGGAVRDMVMGKTPTDWDITTNATPHDVKKIFKRVIPTGIAHGTVTVHFMKNEIEVTTFRTESTYSDGRHPDKVQFASTIYDDLSRRDFTINAIAASLNDGKIIDPYNGMDDIKRKVIKTVGSPLERFNEDGLRPVRAVRFCAKLHFSIETETLQAISNPASLKKTAMVSVERFRDEFIKILATEKPSDALKLFEQTGIMNIFLPELLRGRNCIQNDVRGYHIFDVLDHCLYACDGAPCDKLPVRLAALLHDIGKPDAKVIKQTDAGEICTFYNHESYSEKITREMLSRLKFSNAMIENVAHLVKNHMFFYEPSWSDAAIRRFLVRVGYENIDDLIDLRLADIYGKYNKNVRLHDSESCILLIELKERIEKIHSENAALSLKSLAINGRDLMEIGIPAGKDLGRILNALFETVLDDPAQNTKETLLKIASRLHQERKA